MDKSNLNRRVFLANSSAAATVGTGMVGTAHAAADHPEIEQWKSELGSRFRIEDESFLLKSVSVTDYSTDRARPRNVRPHSIQLLFVRDDARSSDDASDRVLCYRSTQITMTRVIAPEGQTGVFYESIIN